MVAPFKWLYTRSLDTRIDINDGDSLQRVVALCCTTLLLGRECAIFGGHLLTTN